LTRAKKSLWLFGNRQALSGNRVWRSLIEDAIKRKALIPIEDHLRKLSSSPVSINNPRQPLSQAKLAQQVQAVEAQSRSQQLRNKMLDITSLLDDIDRSQRSFSRQPSPRHDPYSDEITEPDCTIDEAAPPEPTNNNQ
jgi:hypothetical protein